MIENLRALQSIDDEARGFLLERNDLQQKLQRLKELLALMEGALEEKKGKLEEASRWYKDKEIELKSDQEKVVKAKTKLQAVTKNKEYMAMQREIESVRKSNLAREEEIMKLVEAMDQFNTSIAEEQAKIATLCGEQQAEEAASADRITELDRKIDSIASRKIAVTGKLTPALLSKYERLFRKRDGMAILPVRNGACSGCNLKIVSQQLQLIIRTETIEQCTSCNRFLYIDESSVDDADDAEEGDTAPVDSKGVATAP
jgi:predicted  nucleic acid-binding Zn-ribbon protein